MPPSVPRRILVDECVPLPLLRAMAELDPRTVQQEGWAGFKNGRLLALAAGQFDVLFTVDRDFAELGNTVPHLIGVVILEVGNADFERLLPHMEAVKAAIAVVEAGAVLRVGAEASQLL